MKRLPGFSFLFALPMISSAGAQAPFGSILSGSGDGAVSGRIIQVFILISALSLLPALLVTMTSFTRFVVALSFLRSGLGLQNTPSNLVMIVLSVFLTGFVMSPTLEKTWRESLSPLIAGQITEQEAFEKGSAPFRDFMLAQVRDKDLKLFSELAKENSPKVDQASVDLRILAPAFMISELRRGFEIGFLIAIPFLVIDMVVAIVLMAMGMMMMPPSVIALPLKILFFILIDGWNLLAGSLVRSVS